MSFLRCALPNIKMLRIFVVLSMICVISGQEIKTLPTSFTDIKDIYQWAANVYQNIDGYQDNPAADVNMKLSENITKSSQQLHFLSTRIRMGCDIILNKFFMDIVSGDTTYPGADIRTKLNKVDDFFEKSRNYARDQILDVETADSFKQKALWSESSLPDLLDEIRQLFITDKYSTGVLDLLHEYSMQHLLHDCAVQASVQQRVYYMYIQLILSELKGLLTLQQIYFRERIVRPDGHNYVGELDFARKNFESHVKVYHDTLIKNVDRFPQHIRRCDAQELKRGENIYELTDFSRIRFLPPVSDLPCRALPSDSQLEQVSQLTGYSIYNCQSMGYSAVACPEAPGSHREYKWWKDYDTTVYGHTSACSATQTIHRDSSWCKVTACSMDQYEIKPNYNKATWRVSLKHQIADTANNMIVTGVKFVIDENTLHLQIHQSNFSYDGVIIHKSSWKDLGSSVTPDSVIERIGYESSEPLDHTRKTIYLDDIVVPDGDVVIGVKLRPEGISAFALEVLAAPYNFQSGILDLSRMKWYGANRNHMKPKDYERKRMQIDLNNSDDPTTIREFDYDLSSNKMVTFTHTDKIKDAGQTTIPLLDAQPVVTSPPFPLRGMGLSVKRKQGFGGYITPRIFTADMFHHMKTVRTVSVNQETSSTTLPLVEI